MRDSARDRAPASAAPAETLPESRRQPTGKRRATSCSRKGKHVADEPHQLPHGTPARARLQSLAAGEVGMRCKALILLEAEHEKNDVSDAVATRGRGMGTDAQDWARQSRSGWSAAVREQNRWYSGLAASYRFTCRDRKQCPSAALVGNGANAVLFPAGRRSESRRFAWPVLSADIQSAGDEPAGLDRLPDLIAHLCVRSSPGDGLSDRRRCC